MKKIFLTLSLFAMSLVTFAQSSEFTPGWNIGARGGVGYTIGEVSFSNLLTPSAALDFGYQFTPVVGLRGDISGLKAKGGLPATYDVYGFNYAQLAADVTFDLCNLFGGYKYRVVNPYVFAGVGGNFAFNNDEANAVENYFPEENYLWSGSKISPVGRVGVGVDFKITPSFAISVEGVSNYLSDHFNSKIGEHSKLDHQIQALVGVKFFPGQGKAAKAAAAASAAAAAAAVAEANKPAPEPVVEPEPAPAPVVAEPVKEEVKEPEAIEEIVYFIINKYDIQSSENEKIQRVVDFMNKYPESKLTVTGIADKDTGTSSRNLFLSQQRAKVVADKIAAMGISKDRISTVAQGDKVNPYPTPAENRVAVCIVK